MDVRKRLVAISSMVVALGGADLVWSSPAAAAAMAGCTDEQIRNAAEGFYYECPEGGSATFQCEEDGSVWGYAYCYSNE